MRVPFRGSAALTGSTFTGEWPEWGSTEWLTPANEPDLIDHTAAFFTGWADGLTAGWASKLQAYLWGEQITRYNTQGPGYTAGQIVGTVPRGGVQGRSAFDHIGSWHEASDAGRHEKTRRGRRLHKTSKTP